MKKMLCILAAAALFLSVSAVFAGCSGGREERNVYCISARYGDGVLSAQMDFTYFNGTGENTDVLEFNLFGNAYREDSAYRPVSAAFAAGAYYDGESWGGMEIVSVSPCASWEISGADENILSVRLAESVAPGKSAVLEICWTLTLAKADHRTGIARRAVNLGNFYPVLCVFEEGGYYECEYYSDGDPFYSECADYRVTLTADRRYTVASSGRMLSAAAGGGDSVVYEMSLDNARDFALVLGEDFSVAQGEACGAQIMYYYYDEEEPEKRLSLIEESLAYFSETFGEYMYPTYSVVQTGFAIGGMEYPALVMIGDRLDSSERSYTIVHETAHQWWYAAVGNNQLENAWMDEGLAEFSTALFFGAHEKYGVTYESLAEGAERAYKAFYTVSAQIFGEADTAMNKKLGEYLSEYQYVVLAYDKGMLLFDTLRGACGEKKFSAGLRRYYGEYAGKIARPEDLCACFKKAGADAAGIVDSFVEGRAVL